VSLSGNIETMPLPDVLQFIGLGKKTGVLRVVHGRAEKKLSFEGGTAVCCSSNNPKEYLGQHLLARTAIGEADLERAFRRQAREGRPLGEILVEAGLISPEELDRVLRRKIEDSMYELFAWQAGDFSFAEGELEPGSVPVRVQLSWESLLMEGARRTDELARIRTLIPSDGVRLIARRERFPEGFPRSGGDRKLVALVERGFSVAQVLTRFHLSDFDILDRLATLCREGLFEVVAGSDEAQDAGDGPDRNELLAEGSRLLAEGRFLEAIASFRSGTQRFAGDHSFADALATAEAQLAARYADADRVVPELAIGLEELTTIELDAQQGFVISRVNGQWSLRSIAQICPFAEAEVLGIFAELERRGLIRVQQPVATS
jgi:hypothetical protein